ncbi:MAG: hypothetical protein PHW14_03505 [Candidatus Omnitrophica bacterium]|nr:hypothetical protein [Candidatus Omnitrophota bacterium]
MNYIEFRKKLGDFTVFSVADIRQADADFHRRRLNEWQDKGYILKVIRGYYVFTEKPLSEKSLFEIANRIYSPSYVSFETALSYHGLIPESVYGITSASTRKTSRFDTEIGAFIYRTIRPKLYFGFEYVGNGSRYLKMASPEKAILDLLYIKTGIKDAEAFESLRLNRERFLETADRKKMNGYLSAYADGSMRRRVKELWGYIKHA